MAERERFFEQLPFMLNGTLAPHDVAWMREQLALHPELQSQLGFHEVLQRGMGESVEASLRGVRPDVGYARTAQRIAAERAPQGAARRWWARAGEWLNPAAASGGWRLAQGAVLGLALGIGVMVAVAPERADFATERGPTHGLADGPLLRVSFQPQATESELRFALVEARASIVAGPTRLGDYYLKAAAGQQAAALAALRRSAIVQQADEVPGLPEGLLE